ncbi:hypothetical protein ACOSP7_002082 [Xanthoceras sorbifolium]
MTPPSIVPLQIRVHTHAADKRGPALALDLQIPNQSFAVFSKSKHTSQPSITKQSLSVPSDSYQQPLGEQKKSGPLKMNHDRPFLTGGFIMGFILLEMSGGL